MNYREFKRNIGKSGLTLNEFAQLLKMSTNSVTNLSKKEKVPKNLAIIATLLGEMADKGVEYKHLFENMDIEQQKSRVQGAFGKRQGY